MARQSPRRSRYHNQRSLERACTDCAPITGRTPTITSIDSAPMKIARLCMSGRFLYFEVYLLLRIRSSDFQHLIRELIQPQTDHLARRIASHCNPVDHVRSLHGIAVMCDDDELRILAQFQKQVTEAAHIRFVEHGVHLVHYTYRRGRDLEQREHQRYCCKTALAA